MNTLASFLCAAKTAFRPLGWDAWAGQTLRLVLHVEYHCKNACNTYFNKELEEVPSSANLIVCSRVLQFLRNRIALSFDRAFGEKTV